MYGSSEIAIGIAALGYYLNFRRASLPLAGVLIAAGLVSCLVESPSATMRLGYGYIIGILGFTPLITSYVFFRNASRCWSQSLQPASQKQSAIMKRFSRQRSF